MSEHVWCQENIAAYVAGGLDVTEGERLENHLNDCGDCARGVEEARALDRKLAPLFRTANPGPALEDRLIRALPSKQARRLLLSIKFSRRVKTCLAVAAVVLLMALGAAVGEFSEPEIGKKPARSLVLLDVSGSMRKDDPFLTTDVDPAAQDVDIDINYKMERLGDVSVPGLRNPREKVVIDGVPKEQPPINLPAPGGFGSGMGGALSSNSTASTTAPKPALISADDLATEMREQSVVALNFDKKSKGKYPELRIAESSLARSNIFEGTDGDKKTPIKELERIVRDQKQIQAQTDRNLGDSKELKEMQDALGRQEKAGKDIGKLPQADGTFAKPRLPVTQQGLPSLGMVITRDKAPPAPAQPGSSPFGAFGRAGNGGGSVGSGGGIGSGNLSALGNGNVLGGPGGAPGMGMMGGGNPGTNTPGSSAPPSDHTQIFQFSLGMYRDGPAPTNSLPLPFVPGRPSETSDKADNTKKPDLAWNNSTNGKLPGVDGRFFIPADDTVREESTKDKLDKSANVPPPAKLPAPSPSLPGVPPSAERPSTPTPPPPVATTGSPPGLTPVAPDGTPVPADPASAQKPSADKKEPQSKEPPAKVEPAQPQQPAAPRRVIIRTGELEFEIDSFDASVAAIMKLINATKGGFVATINSDKLPNGKVRGSVVIRIPPEHLDQFVLDLRKDLGKVGELKNQRIGSQDITKQYTDLESRLRAARTMEDRLLNIIKDGKGQIKDLLLAEKELGVWRTQIEEVEGELRYYGNMASLSTLTIKLYEKNIGSAATITESERVQAGLEVEDVEKVRKEALKAIEEVKGRVTRDELKQLSAGQFNAILYFEVSHDAAGPTRDRLKQLGTMVRLQIDRLQTTEDGSPPAKNGKIERGPTQFQLSIYNLANITPRESNVLRLAVSDVPGTYQKLRDAVGKAKGHVVNAQLNEQDKQKINAQLDFNVRRLSEAEILTALAGIGETLSRQVVRLPEGDNVTDSKVAFSISLVDADFIQPRETVTVRIVAADVKTAYEALREALGKTKTKTRVLTDQLNDQDKRNITAQLDFTFSRAEEGDLQKALDKAGETLSRQVTRLPESNNVTDAKVLARVELIAADTIQPRETLNIRIAADDLRGAFQKLRTALITAKARVINAQVNEQDRQNITAQIDFTFPRADEAVIQTALTGAGETLARLVTRLPESASVTDAKVLVRVELLPTDALMPRESTTLTIAVADVPAAYETLRSLVAKVKGKVLAANINKEDRGSVAAQLAFTFPRGDESIIQTALGTAGETLIKKVDRVLEPGNYTDTKMLAVVKLEQADSLAARETVIVKIAAVDVPASYQALRTAIGKAKGRITSAKLNEQDRGNITAHISFDVPRAEEAALQTLLVNIGETLTRQSNREQDSIKVTDTKIGFDLDLSPATAVPPRETTVLGLKVSDVPETMFLFTQMVKEAQGRVIKPQIGRDREGKVAANAVFDVPLPMASSLVEKFKLGRNVVTEHLESDPQAPEGKLALGRIIVVVSGVDPIVPNDQGATAELRKGLSVGVWGFSKMLNWLIVGASFLLPLLVFVPIIWLGRKFLGGGGVRQGKPTIAGSQTTAG